MLIVKIKIMNESQLFLFKKYLASSENEEFDEFAIRVSKQIFPNSNLQQRFYEFLRDRVLTINIALANKLNKSKEYNYNPNGSSCKLLEPTKLTDEVISNILLTAMKGTGIGISLCRIDFKEDNDVGSLQGSFISFCRFLNIPNVSFTKRPSRIAVYLNLHNVNYTDMMELRKRDNLITPNVFYGVLIPNLFMKILKQHGYWFFFNASTNIDGITLNDVYGLEYEELYNKMVMAKLYTSKVSAISIYNDLIQSIAMHGFPYVSWRDALNLQNIIKCDPINGLNLCTEISQVSLPKYEDSVCSLMALNLNIVKPDTVNFINLINSKINFNFTLFMENRKFPIDSLFYLIETAFYACNALNQLIFEYKRREIGISTNGYYDFIKYHFKDIDKNELMNLCREIAECIYLGSILGSIYFYKMYNIKCSMYKYTLYSQGKFQFELTDKCNYSKAWNDLRPYIKEGMANSLLTTLAPGAFTSNLSGVMESCQLPYSSEYMKFISGRKVFKPQLSLKIDSYGNEDFSIKDQMSVYKGVYPFIDQCISMIFNNVSSEAKHIHEILIDTFNNRMKNAIYYVNFKNPGTYIKSKTQRDLPIFNNNINSDEFKLRKAKMSKFYKVDENFECISCQA